MAVEHSDGRTDGARLLGQPKRLAILAYLTLPAPGTWHLRTTLLRIFYPDRPPAQGRNALRNALHALRATLGESVLLTRGDEAVSISPTELSTDVSERASREALEGGGESVPEHRGVLLPDLESVVEGAEFTAWLAAERRRFVGAGSSAPSQARPQQATSRRLAALVGVAGVAALILAVLPGNVSRFRPGPVGAESPPNPEAVRLVAAAFHELERGDPDALARAKALYLRAVDADPTYGPAFTGLGRTWMYLANSGQVPREQGVRMLRDALGRAAQFSDSLDPDILDARAYLAYSDGHAAEALRLKRMAIAQAPERAELHEHLAHLLTLEGQLGEARAHLDTAILLAPLDRRFPESAAYVEGCRGDDSTAVRLLLTSLSIDSGYARAWRSLVPEYARLAKWSEALDAWRRADSGEAAAFVQAAGSDSATFVTSWAAFQHARRDTVRREGRDTLSPLDRVLTFAVTGDRDSALWALDLLRSQDPMALGYAICAWPLRPLRADPRVALAFRGTPFEPAFARVMALAARN